MRSILRSLVLAPAVMVAAAFTANSAMAATVDVPFNFMVAGKWCPAGSYSVKTSGQFVNLMGTAQKFTWIAGPGDPAPTDRRIVLKFDQLGSAHVLRSVQYGPMVTSRLDKKVKQADDESVQTVAGQ